MYWVNSKNDKIITADKWIPQFRFNLSNPDVSGEGCVAAEIYVEHRYLVSTRLTKVPCDREAGVVNLLCEKTDVNDPGMWKLCQ